MHWYKVHWHDSDIGIDISIISDITNSIDITVALAIIKISIAIDSIAPLLKSVISMTAWAL